MCDPLTIGSMVVTGIGMKVQADAANDAEKAARGAREAEDIRQGKYLDEGMAAQSTAQSEYAQENFSDDLAAQIAEAAAKYKDAQQGTPADFNFGDRDVDNAVVQNEIKHRNEADAFAKAQADALAALRGFDFTMGDKAIDRARSGETTGLVGNFMQGSASVLQTELEAAARKANSPIGDALVMAGQLGSMAGLAGSGPSWGDIFGGFGGAPAGAPQAAISNGGISVAAKPWQTPPPILF